MNSNRRDSLDTPHGSIALSPLPPVFKMSFCVLTTEKFTSREYDSRLDFPVSQNVSFSIRHHGIHGYFHVVL